MQVRKLLMLLGMFIPFTVSAQLDSTGKKKISLFKKPINTTKLEISYQRVMYTTTSGTHSVLRPGIRVNDARPVDLDGRGNMLRKYYIKAPLSNEQLDLAVKQRRQGNYQLIAGLVGGGITAFSGVFASVNQNRTTPLWTRFGIGAGMITTGVILKVYHSKKANQYVLNSVSIYNTKYYKPLAADTAKLAADNTKKETIPKTTTPEYKEYKDTVNAYLLRNAPQNSAMAGFILDIAQIDINSINSSISGGIGAYYTYKSRIAISALYSLAYFDNMQGTHNTTRPQSFESYGVPSRYQRGNSLEFLVKTPVISRLKEKSYHLHLGQDGGIHSYARVKGNIMKAMTARIGYKFDNRIAEGDIGMPFQTTTEPYPGAGSVNMSWSSAMMRSNIISLGIGLSTFRDMKINLQDPDYKGRREEKGQFDLYADLLYAYSIKFQDINYFHSGSDFGAIPQRMNLSGTPVKKIGVRIGVQQMTSYNSWSGTRIRAEVGLTPGPDMHSLDGQWFLRLCYGFIFGGRIDHTK